MFVMVQQVTEAAVLTRILVDLSLSSIIRFCTLLLDVRVSILPFQVDTKCIGVLSLTETVPVYI